MRFATPLALLLLLALVPYLVVVGRPKVAYRRRRDTFSLVLRLLLIALIVLGLAGLQTVQAADKLAVVFLVDSSDSISAAMKQTAETYVRDAMGKMTPDDRAGIVVFGKNALVDRPLTNVKDPGIIASTPIRLETDMAEALRLGLAMFPSDAARRIVILSDGLETTGNAAEVAKLAAAQGVQIDYVPLQRKQGAEILVSDVRAPSKVNAGEEFDLDITIESQTETNAIITVLSGGTVVTSDVRSLRTGSNSFTIPLRAPAQGFNSLEVKVDPVGGAGSANDTFYQNNALATFTEVGGPPRLLLVTENPQEIAVLLPVLQGAGYQVDVVAPNDLPIGLAPLAAYKGVIMANVSATNLTETRMRTLQTYVRDLGGGLITIGGPNSYGVGGYFQTPLEEMLPVEMQIKDQKRVPSLTMIYVIDRSGSMEVIGPSGVTNLELGKEASRRSVNFLFERDQAGVLSFDSDPQWLVPIQRVVNRSAIISQIGRLRPGGGTDIFAAVKQIEAVAPKIDTNLKHVILLTDGGADPAGVLESVQRMHDLYGVTVTAIGIGTDVPAFMRDIPRVGGGSYYNLRDLSTIPQIFAAETVLATRSYIEEYEFVPGLSAPNNPIMKGITTMPPLLGYVATTAKDTATVVLREGKFNDPILATWQYGLGRTVAFTSDATARWAKNWMSWSDYQRFWTQLIRSTIVEGTNSALETRVELRNGKAVLVVDARRPDGSLINGLTLDASVVDPRLGSQAINLRQVAPGRYEAEFDPATEGAYFLRVAGSGEAGAEGVAQTAGWVLSYSPEYRIRDTDLDLLGQMATLTGGRSIVEKPELAFAHTIRAEQAATSLWPWLLLLALLLLPFDIAIRRIILTPTDIVKLRAWLSHRLGLDRRQTETASATRLAVLREAKERASATMPSASTPSAITTATATSVQAPVILTDTPAPKPPISAASPSVVTPPPSASVVSPQAAPATATAPSEEDDSAGSLASRLKAKRQRKP